ncbi:MAG: hypothetical protein ACUZ8H_16010 [Candidatus Anammoxibacter sp.]
MKKRIMQTKLKKLANQKIIKSTKVDISDIVKLVIEMLYLSALLDAIKKIINWLIDRLFVHRIN